MLGPSWVYLGQHPKKANRLSDWLFWGLTIIIFQNLINYYSGSTGGFAGGVNTLAAASLSSITIPGPPFERSI